MIEVPAVVRNKAVTVGAAAWLAELPALVADLAQEVAFLRFHRGAWPPRLGSRSTPTRGAIDRDSRCA